MVLVCVQKLGKELGYFGQDDEIAFFWESCQTSSAMAAADAAASAEPALSNIETLDEKTKRYLQLFHKKQQLLAAVREIHTEMGDLKAPLIEQLTAAAQSVPICPSKSEEETYGGIGSLVVKLKNDYETLTRDNLVRLVTEFFQYLLPEGQTEEVQSLAQGTACWIWNNRRRTPLRYLERTFVVKAPSRPNKRKADAAADAAADGPPPVKPVRAPRFKPKADIPLSRDDFLAVPSLAHMLTSAHNLPQHTDDPEGEGSAEDDLCE